MLMDQQPASASTAPPIPDSPEPSKEVKPVKTHKPRHFLAAFFFSFMWGTFGVDRFYMGYIGYGILKLITAGGFGIWTIIDLVFIMTGFMKDKQGQSMLQVEEYKKFAARTVFWFAVCTVVFVLINGLLLIWGVYDAIMQLQSGKGGGWLNQLINGLNFGGDSSQINQLLGE